MIYKNLLDLIGSTPIIEYEGIFIKLEQFNLAGSIKDRVALEMIKQLEIKKQIHENSTVIEVTSGNTGIAIAMICAIKRYKCIIIMLDNVSTNIINLVKAYGAKVLLSPFEFGLSYANEVAKTLEKEKGYIYLNQFCNEFNPLAHVNTANEIRREFSSIDYLVCGIGTGGTITGLGKSLKEVYPNIKIIGVLPKSSYDLISGIGANMKSDFLDFSLIDEIVYISSSEVLEEFKRLSSLGFLLGYSSVANFIVSKRIKTQNKDKIVLMISADSGIKYLETSDNLV